MTKFYINTLCGFQEREGYRVPNNYGLDLFAHSVMDGKERLWSITEGGSGLRINRRRHHTKKAAIAEVFDYLDGHLEELKSRLIELAGIYGISPLVYQYFGAEAWQADADEEKEV